LARVKVGHLSCPASANSFGAVDEQEGQDGTVVLGLDALSVVVEVGEERVVFGVEEEASERTEVGEDVARRGGVFAAVEASAELADGQEEVAVVGADEVLSQVDYGAHEGGLAVVVGGELGH